jgi:hypothetical protein
MLQHVDSHSVALLWNKQCIDNTAHLQSLLHLPLGFVMNSITVRVQVQSASSYDDVCFQPTVAQNGEHSHTIGLFIQNTGSVPIPNFQVIFQGQAARSSRGPSTRGASIGITLGVAILGVMLIVCFMWYQAGCKGLIRVSEVGRIDTLLSL